MKKYALLATAASLLAFGGIARAADAITEAPPAAPMATAPVVYDWTGFYLGLEGGYVSDDLDVPILDDLDGGMVGGHVGYNWQSGNFVFGVEGNVDYIWNKEEVDLGPGSLEVRTDVQGSLRARLGYAMDNALLYATGGYAVTRAKADLDFLGFHEEETFGGWTVGGGLEYAFSQNWTGRIEYRYTDYGSEDFGTGNEIDLTEHAVRLGVSYKF